jgi:AraC-like DNA-binding protein
MGDFIQVIFYGGALQGLLLAVFLFSIRTNTISNRLLGFLSMCWGIVLLLFVLQDKGFNVKYPLLGTFIAHLVFLFFPLLYLHVKYLLTSFKSFQWKDLFHFTPFIFGLLLNIGFIYGTYEERLEILENPSPYYQIVEIIEHEILSLQGIVYSILAFLLIRKYQSKIKDYVSTLHKNLIRVLYVGISMNLLSWTLGIIDVHLRYFKIELGVDLFAFTYLILALVIYVISYAALKSPEVFKLEMGFKPGGKIVFHDSVRDSKLLDRKQAPEVISSEPDDTIHFNKLNAQLIAHIENEKPFLNPELSLPSLADSLETSRNQLSEVINKVHKKNFYEFINGYRVAEVKRLMDDPKNKHLKLISLAYDAGFNSKATFNRIFKQVTNLTPSQYLAQNGSG